MANEHIELVKKWLANPESVSKERLEDNYKTASDSSHKAYLNGCLTMGLSHAARASAYANDGDANTAAHWVKNYEEATNAK